MKPHINSFRIGRRLQWQCRVVGEEDVAVAKTLVLAYESWIRKVCPHDTCETIGGCGDGCCAEVFCADCGKIWMEAL